MSDGEGLFLGLAIAMGAFVFIGIIAVALGKPKPPPPPQLPPPPMWPASPPLTHEEAAALAHANAIGVAVDFIQPHPHTGQRTLFRATPLGGGHGQISLAPQPAYGHGTITKTV